MRAIDGLRLEEIKESDMEIGDCSTEEESDDNQDLDPDLKKALKIKDKNEKNPEKDKANKKENAWEVASRVGDKESSADIKTKLLKFKTELMKDVAVVEQKIHELKQTCPKEKSLLKDAMKSTEAGKKHHEKLDKMARTKFSKHEAACQLKEAHKVLLEIKTTKMRLLKALKA